MEKILIKQLLERSLMDQILQSFNDKRNEIELKILKEIPEYLMEFKESIWYEFACGITDNIIYKKKNPGRFQLKLKGVKDEDLFAASLIIVYSVLINNIVFFQDYKEIENNGVKISRFVIDESKYTYIDITIYKDYNHISKHHAGRVFISTNECLDCDLDEKEILVIN